MAAAAGVIALLSSGGTGAGLIPRAALEPKWNPAHVQSPALGVIPEVKPERFQLDNGLVVYLMRDAEFPDLSGYLLVHAATAYDPPDKVGLGRLTGIVLRSGGTARMPGDSLDARLEEIGARIETSIDESSGTASFYCLKEYQDEVLALFRDLLAQPAFPQDKLDLAKLQIRRQIASRNDDPSTIARRVLRATIWGKDHPWAREIEYATLDAIGAQDLEGFHHRYFVPNQMVLAVCGDLDPAEMKTKLTALFSGWKRSEEPLPPEPALPAGSGNGIYYAEKTRVTQSTVFVGEIGIKADNPDYPALDVLAELLGGGFSSRIVNHIRTERGLAYAAGAGAGVGYQHPGIFSAYALTRSDSTLVTLELLRSEVRRLVSEAPGADEVRKARESLLNSFVFNFRSPAQVVNRQAFFEFAGYPPDFLTTYQEALRKVTPQDILRVARAHIHPEAMKVLVVGNQADFERPLSTLGKVETVDLTIPGQPQGGP